MSTESNVDANTCCKCIKTKCLKRYCDCFASGLYCGESCFCKECFNLPVYEDLVQEAREQKEKRNPHAFSPKIQTLEVGDSLIPITEEKIRTGCKCKKSRCFHKNCECYKAKVGCWAQCQCEGCRNEYGMKGTSRRDNGTVLLDEVLNRFISQDMNAEYFKSVKKPSYSPSPKAGSFYHDMMIGTSRMDSDNSVPFDQLEVMNRLTNQDISATHMKSMMNLSHSPSSQAESSNSYMVIGTSKIGCECRVRKCWSDVCKCYRANVECGGECGCVGCKNLHGKRGMMIESTTKDSDMDPMDEIEFVNQLIQSPDETSNLDMMIGSGSRDSDIVHVDRLEFVFRSQFTPQEFNARQDDREKTKNRKH